MTDVGGLEDRNHEQRVVEQRILEHSTLKVPYEVLNKKFRGAQKVIDREISHVAQATGDIDTMVRKSTGPILAGELSGLVDAAIDKLAVLKRKAAEAVIDETSAATVIKRRVEHLKIASTAHSNAVTIQQWRKVRLDRMLIGYLLRIGCYESAARLAKHQGIDYLTDVDIFLTAMEVEQTLINRDTSKCLEWCHDHKSKLRRLKSNLEIKVRQQEFIELVRLGQRLQAARYAQRHFATLDKEHWGEAAMLSVMGLLAYGPDTKIPAYKKLFADERWSELLSAFRAENFRVYQLSTPSTFAICIQCGLAALKSHQCYSKLKTSPASPDSSSLGSSPREDAISPDSPRESLPWQSGKAMKCPVCVAEVGELGKSLPFAHVARSKLVCACTGEPLNENNHPMMLPNGMVYGLNALKKFAEQNGGSVVCPRTGDVFQLADAEKLFVM